MEKLRKLFWALGSVLVVLFALTFSSCSDDDDDDKDKGDASSLVGTWRFNDDGVYYITFKADGTGRYEDDYEDSSFEYIYNEKTALLILDFGHGDQDIVNVVSLTSSKLTLQDPEDGYTFTGTRLE
ncbi:DUF5640 domain-containing protein [Phocaeicola coprocola]|jgi:hypothetical protein